MANADIFQKHSPFCSSSSSVLVLLQMHFVRLDGVALFYCLCAKLQRPRPPFYFYLLCLSRRMQLFLGTKLSRGSSSNSSSSSNAVARGQTPKCVELIFRIEQ
jgi:hypothetical protein